jgi:hypothetical protein
MRKPACLALVLTVFATPAVAQAPPPQPAHDVNTLAKQTQNPVGDLTSVPFQFNFNTGGDLEQRTFFNLNFQPVIPFKATANWNVIARMIVPVNSFPGPDETRYSGAGDIQAELFITPSEPGGLIWGIGPTFSFPTATSTAFETGTWAAGPAVVLVRMTGPFVLGGLISQLWPLSDAAGDPKTDLFTFQPFVNYNFGHGWAMAFAPIITANWNAPSGHEWTVPLGVGVTRTTVFNHRPMNVGVQYYYNVERPDGSAGQQLKFVVSLLYPR